MAEKLSDPSVITAADYGTEAAATVLARHCADGTIHIMEIAQTPEEHARLEKRLNWLRMKERLFPPALEPRDER